MFENLAKSVLGTMITEAYEEGYKRGAEDIIRRMSFVYEIARRKGREEGFVDAGAIDIEEITKEEWEDINA